MRILITTISAFFCLALAAGPAWGDVTADISIYVENDDYESHPFLLSNSLEKYKTVDSGDTYHYSHADIAYWLVDTTYTYFLTVYDHSGDYEICYTEITFTISTLFGTAIVADCSATSFQTDGCSLDYSTSGTTCNVTATIND